MSRRTCSEQWGWVAGWHRNGDEDQKQALRPGDHHFRGLDERERGVTGLKREFVRRIGCDDGCDALTTNRQHDFGEQAIDDNLCDGTKELIATADARRWALCGGRQKLFQRLKRDTVVPPGVLTVWMRPARIQCFRAG